MNMGSTSTPETVTLSNTGNASLSISGIALGGGDSSAFSQSNNCGSSVAAGAACTFSVTFSPFFTGPFSAAITVNDNGVFGQQTIELAGTGTPQATPPGNYQVQVTASYGGDVHNVSVPVNLQ